VTGERRQLEDVAAKPSSEDGSVPMALLSRPDFAASAAVALIALVAYVLTLSPGLLRADSGEFQTLAVTLGYNHPTGYPVYLLLAKAATAIPIGDMAYRVNLLSGIMGAATAGVLVLLGKLLTGRRWLSLAGGLALAFSPTFWSQAIIAEVYTSGTACMLVVLLWLGLWQASGRLRWLFAGACLGGVSLGVHATVALMAPAAVLFVLLHARRPLNTAVAVAGVAVGLAVTLVAFAVIDRADNPCCYFNTVIDPSRSEWGLELEDTDEFLERVKLSLSAPQFRGIMFSQTIRRTAEKTAAYLRNLPREFPPLWLAAALAGVYWLGRRNVKMTWLLLLTCAGHLWFDLQLEGVVYALYIPTYVLIALFGVAGLAWFADACRRLAANRGKREYSSAAWDRACAIAAVVIVGWPMLFADAWNEEGRRAFWLPPEEAIDWPGVAYCEEYHNDVGELLSKLEDDAVVFTGWCHLYPYYYVAHLEQGRTKMRFFLDYHDGTNRPVLADSAVEMVKSVKQITPERPIYFTHVVGQIAEFYEFERVHEGFGPEPLYRVGKSIGPK